jgi:hypothetical protein
MSRTVDLRARGSKTVLVKKDSAMVSDNIERNYSQVIIMDPFIETYRDAYADDLEARLELNADKLLTALTVSTLLNPMMGLESTIVGTGLMSETQYRRARNTVISMMHDILDMKSDVVVVSSSDDSSDDEQVPHRENANHSRANDEFIAFEKLKRKKYLPVLAKPEHGGLVGEYNGKVKELWVGKVVEKEKNLPSKKNLADYIDERGRIQLIAFFCDHRKSFPTLWLLVQKEASRCVTEVGCERFFALSRYVSAPRRTRLGVRNYESETCNVIKHCAKSLH